jgi:predicted Zn-dependent peptidase
MFYRETVLPNGITIRTEHMDSVRSITLGIWFKVGSRDETLQEAGLSHFMEHMFFKGTTSRTAAEISGAFDELGAELNAFTSKEYTCYYARFVDEKLERSVELLSDMLVNSKFAPDCIESEREVVIEEIARSEDAPEEDVYDVFHEAMFPTHTLGRPVLGSRESVGSFAHDDCAGYLKKHYNTANCCIAAAGNIDHDILVEMVKRYFAAMPVGQRKIRDLGKETDRLFSRFIQKDTEQAHMVIGVPGLPIDDSDRFAQSLLDMLFGGSMASRLFQEVREKNGLAYAIFAESLAYQGEGAFSIYAGTRPDNLMKVATIIKHELDRIIAEGATSEELERVRSYAVGQTLLRTEATRNHMTRLGKSSVTDAELLSFEEAVERYNAVTLDQVNNSVQRIYSQAPTVAVISPFAVDEVAHIMEHALA